MRNDLEKHAGADPPDHPTSPPTQSPACRLGWAWFTGADPRVVQLAPSELNFLRRLGLLAAAMAVVSGLVLASAASNWWNLSLIQALWIAPVFTALMVLVERAVLSSFSTKWLLNALIALPRVALSLAAAAVLGLPATQFIFSRSIENQMSATAAAQAHAARAGAIRFYQPKIAAAEAQIASMRAHESSLTQAVIRYTELAQCEAGEVACSQTHKLGCGPVCHRDLDVAASKRNELASIKSSDAQKTDELKTRIAQWQGAEQKEISGRTKAIDGNTDFLARQDALQAVEKTHPSVAKYVTFCLAWFVALDLLCLILKLCHMASSGCAYEHAAEALRKQDAVGVYDLTEQATVGRRRITAQARADEEVDEVAIAVDREHRIAAAEASLGTARTQAPRSSERINAFNLDDLVNRMGSHEQVSVPLDRGLRIGGWVGTALIALLSAALAYYSYTGNGFVSAEWVVFAAFILAVSLAAFTKGFRRAPAWAARATFATLLLGLALPILVLSLNVI